MQQSTHPGLWLDRYLRFQTDVPGAHDANDDRVKGARTVLMREVAEQIAQANEYLDIVFQRVGGFLDKSPGRVREVRTYKTVGRCVVGLGQKGVTEVGLTLERTWGVPILPGSSIKGVAAAVAHQLIEDDAWRKAPKDGTPGDSFGTLFGTTERRGKVVFHDAWWLPSSVQEHPLAQDIMTVHHPNYYQRDPGSNEFAAPDGTDSPIPVSFLTTKAGIVFAIALEADEADQAWLEAAWQLLEIGLADLGVGAKTNAGYGRFVHDPDSLAKVERAWEDAIAKQARNAAFESGTDREKFDVLLRENVASGAQKELYERLRSEPSATNPFDYFGIDVDTSSTREQLWGAFREALRNNDVWRSALVDGKQWSGANVGGAKLRKLGSDLGLGAEVEASEVSEASESLSAKEHEWLESIDVNNKQTRKAQLNAVAEKAQTAGWQQLSSAFREKFLKVAAIIWGKGKRDDQRRYRELVAALAAIKE